VGWAKKYYLPKKCLKNILYSFFKVEKHTILVCQGGASAPSCPPRRTPMSWDGIENRLEQKLKSP